jgi:hypothetical protein
MLVKTALGIAILTVAQAPVRLLASVMVLRHSRRACPELFDGRVCAAAVAACVEEYRRMSLPSAPPRPARQGCVDS